MVVGFADVTGSAVVGLADVADVSSVVPGGLVAAVVLLPAAGFELELPLPLSPPLGPVSLRGQFLGVLQLEWSWSTYCRDRRRKW